MKIADMPQCKLNDTIDYRRAFYDDRDEQDGQNVYGIVSLHTHTHLNHFKRLVLANQCSVRRPSSCIV